METDELLEQEPSESELDLDFDEQYELKTLLDDIFDEF